MSWLLFPILYYICVVRGNFIIKLYGTSTVMDICLNCEIKGHNDKSNDKSRIKIAGYMDNELNQIWDLHILEPLNIDESGYQIQSKNNGLCVTFGAYKDNNNETSDKLWLDYCETTNSQIWIYKHNQLKVPDYKKNGVYQIKNKCLQVNDMDNIIRVAPCDINDSYQIWNIARVNTSTTQTITPTNNPIPTEMTTKYPSMNPNNNMDLIDLDTESEVINKKPKLILIITVPVSIVILYLILVIVLMMHNNKLLKTKLPMVPNNSNTENKVDNIDMDNKHNQNEHEYKRSNSTIIIYNEWSDMKLPVHNHHKSATIESGIEGAIVHVRDIQPHETKMNENYKSETDTDEGTTNGTNTPTIDVATKKV